MANPSTATKVEELWRRLHLKGIPDLSDWEYEFLEAMETQGDYSPAEEAKIDEIYSEYL